jgi:acyl-homoserine lactone acylase PvdQ
MRGVLESFQRGIKQFMQDHPEQVPAWAQQIQPWDAVALGRYIIWNWPMGEASADLKRAGVEFGPLSYRGSNEMLIAPKRTALNAAIAIVDPHVQWYDAMRFYEVRIYTPEYNVSGVSILGAPFPTLGHSRYCSVAMTTGGPDTSDIFEEEVNPANPDQYRYDGQWRDFTFEKVTIGVKKDSAVELRPITLTFSHHGPIVARKEGKAYAMAIPYADEVGLLDQSYLMMTARNLAEMKQALSRLQLMAQNIMVATVEGDIFYLRNGRVPIRAKGVDPSRPIPGNTSATEWKGIHPISDLVQIENPPCGWMQNCNCSPAAMMNRDQPRHDSYKDFPHIYNESPSADAH